MRAVVQRVSACRVQVAGQLHSEIGHGILVYVGISATDTEKDCAYTAEKAAHLRIFPDDTGKPNRSVIESGGEAMVISQFTLYGDTRKGRRPSYNEAAPPEVARRLYDRFVIQLGECGVSLSQGEFQANMDVSYTNHGPFTILIDSEKKF